MSPADNTPDFDKMTPEEIMTWMESLAKRQGANENELMTTADVDIAAIDPSSVVIDEPGYVPSEGKMKGKKIEGINTFKSPEAAPPAAVETPAPPPKAVEPLPPPPQETFPEPASATLEPAPAAEPDAALQGSMSWLESLAADQGVEFPSLDFSSVAADLAPAAPTASTANPVDWLESLAQSEGVTSGETAAPAQEASGDPMAWLESLAKRQGANDEELMTDANVDIPLPDAAAVDGPGYTNYSFDMPGAAGKVGTGEHTVIPTEPVKDLEPAALEDPAAWLDSLATGQGFDNTLPPLESSEPAETKMSDSDINAALARGEVVPHDQMEAWMSRQLEIGAQRSEPEELSAYDPDAPAVPADIPDWLIDQVGQAPPVEETPKATVPSEPPPLLDAIFEPPAVADMPDWLKDEPESNELDSIFANTLEQEQSVIPPPPQETFAPPLPPAPVVAQAAPAGDVDTADPWVEAFEIEYKERQGDTSPTPAPTSASAIPSFTLEDAALSPESELPLGEPEDVPDWLEGVVSGVEEDAVPADIPDWLRQDVTVAEPKSTSTPITADVPDWLTTSDIEPTEIPDWLKSTLGTSEQVVVLPDAASLVPVASSSAIVPPRPTVGYSPAPVPTQATQIDVQGTLNNARSQANANDVDGSLQNYELLIRANVELDAVVGDVTKLLEKFKTTPAVYRVLGDALMRQGKLQIALDTYRKALNQL
ncbi:MAG: hypothetical protein ABI690_27150 [Chloroflexota bacterium]